VDERLACSLILFLNVYSSQKPVSLSLQLSPANERHGYNTRQVLTGHFTFPLPRTNALKKTNVQSHCILECAPLICDSNKKYM